MQNVCFFNPPEKSSIFNFQSIACVHRLYIKGRPVSSWPQKMTTVSCVMPRSVHWPSLRHTIKARTMPRNCGSLKPNRTPLTCRSPCLFIFTDYFFPNFFTPTAEVMAMFSDRNIIAYSQSSKCYFHASAAERAPVRQLPNEAGKMAASTDW